MPHTSNCWTLILAGGAGKRVASLTSDACGASVPKQYCSLNGGPSLLEETFERACAVTRKRRIVAVVAVEHRRFWQNTLSHMLEENIIVQPENRGTANGILLGLMTILERDPEALLTVLPSDHYVAQKEVLEQALARALTALRSDACSSTITFLGIEPEVPDPELGYIVHGELQEHGSYRITRFIEKPSRETAAGLLAAHALWNSFIIVARAISILTLIERRFAAEVTAFRNVWHRAMGADGRLDELGRLYERLPEIDFSRDVVEGSDVALSVRPVPACGWTDLGTPARVAACLERFGHRRRPARSQHLSLAEAARRESYAAAAVELDEVGGQHFARVSD